MKVGIILGQIAYELQRSLDYKIGTLSETFAVLTFFEWIVNGLMTGKESDKICHFVLTDDVKVPENIQNCWDIETYASKINVVSRSENNCRHTKIQSTTKFTASVTKWEWYGLNQSQTY